MKQWFSYRNLPIPNSTSKINPSKILEESFGDMITRSDWEIGIGEGSSNADMRILGYVNTATQDEADAVISALSSFGCKVKSAAEAHNLLETLTGWDVTLNGDNLEITITKQGEDETYIW